MSPTSSKWDLRTEMTVNMLRDMLGPNSTPTPISKLQRLTCKDPGVKGKVWVSKVQQSAPEEDDVRQMMFKAIEDMGTGKRPGRSLNSGLWKQNGTGTAQMPRTMSQNPHP